MKKRIITIIFGLVVLFAGADTYANTVYDTDLFTIIRNSLSTRLNNQVDKDYIDDQKKAEISDYINNKENELNNNLSTYEDELKKQKLHELEQYLNDVKQEIDSIYREEETKAKSQMSKLIEKELKDLQKEIEEELKELFK